MKKTIWLHLVLVLVLFFPLGGLLGECVSFGVFLTAEFVYIFLMQNDGKMSRKYIPKIAGVFGIFVLCTALSNILYFLPESQSEIIAEYLPLLLRFGFWSLGIYAGIKIMEKESGSHQETSSLMGVLLIILVPTIVIRLLENYLWRVESSAFNFSPDSVMGMFGMMSGYNGYSPFHWLTETLLPLTVFYVLCVYMISKSDAVEKKQEWL